MIQTENDYDFKKNSIVLVKGDKEIDGHFTFWIGKVNGMMHDFGDRVSGLQARWFEPLYKKDFINSK